MAAVRLGIGIRTTLYHGMLLRAGMVCLVLAKQAAPLRRPVNGVIRSTRAIAASMALATTSGEIMCIRRIVAVLLWKFAALNGLAAAAVAAVCRIAGGAGQRAAKLLHVAKLRRCALWHVGLWPERATHCQMWRCRG